MGGREEGWKEGEWDKESFVCVCVCVECIVRGFVCVCVCVECIVRGEKANLVSGMKCGGRGRCSPTQLLQNRASQRKSPTSDATPYLADSCGPPRQLAANLP